MVSSTREVAFAATDTIRDARAPDANTLGFHMFASNMKGGRYAVPANPARMRVVAAHLGLAVADRGFIRPQTIDLPQDIGPFALGPREAAFDDR